MTNGNRSAKDGSASGGKLIIGLGNPGLKYKHTWHNLGFLTLDNLIKENQLSKFKKNKKLQAKISANNINGQKIILAKPLTFMNNSGQATQAVVNYYKIKPENIIIVHDDIDLPLEKIRITHDSSAGGHNGVKSIIQCLGTKNFIRVKIGINVEMLRRNVSTEKFVLQKFSHKNKPVVIKTIKKATQALDKLVAGENVETAMSRFN